MNFYTKHFKNIFHLNKKKTQEKCTFFVSNFLWLFVKIILTIFAIFILVYFVREIIISIEYKNAYDYNVNIYVDNMTNSINELSLLLTGHEISSNVYSQIQSLSVIDIDPITANTVNDLNRTIRELNMISRSCLIAAEAFADGSAIPGVDLTGVADWFLTISKEANEWALYLTDYLNNTVMPLISHVENQWSSIVVPLSKLVDSLMWILITFSGLGIFIPLFSGGEGFLGAPIYFEISFIISLIMMVVIIISQLLNVSSSGTNEKKKKSIGKNIFGGLFMTLGSLIFIPLLFIMFSYLTITIVYVIFDSLGMDTEHINNITENFSYIIYSNSFKGGAATYSFLQDSSVIEVGPYGYYRGDLILLTPSYFDYTLFAIISSLFIIFEIVIVVLIIIKFLQLLQLMIIGPITNAFFIKDGGVSFNSWFSQTSATFFELIVIGLQIAIFVIIAYTINFNYNSELSNNNYLFLIMIVVLFAGLTITSMLSFLSIRKIFFKDNNVKAKLDSRDLKGLEVDSNIKNKSLEIESKTLSNSLKKSNELAMKNMSLSKSSMKIDKNMEKLNSDLLRTINNQKYVSSHNKGNKGV